MRVLAWLLLLFTVTGARGAGKKTVTVAADGSAEFKDVQAAIDSAPTGGLVIRIKPGTYHQLLKIEARGIELHGLGAKPEDVLLTFGNSAGMAGGTSKSASVTITGDDFIADNLTFENSFQRDQPESRANAQAVAVLVTGDHEIFRHVRFLGAQDTLYAASKTCHGSDDVASGKPCHASRQYFSDCYIAGHVDFIFGDAKAVFDHCEIHAIAHPVITITAQSRDYPAKDSGYLFRDCTVTADAGVETLLLGRPWRDYSTVIFINTDLKASLADAGWAEWGGRLKTSDYAEFGSHGLPGDLTARIAGTRQLTADEAAKDTVKAWLAGPDGWDPANIK